MLHKIVNLIENKLSPYYIVGETNKEGITRYIKHLAIKSHPSFPSDDILEQTTEIWEAQLFCRKDDALAVMKERTGFGCDCGNCNKVGKVLQVTASGREKEGITYGTCICDAPDYSKNYFETVYNVTEVECFTQY